MKKENGFGFTLIELLIVVAIIAILAAIAVPNFLEAQVRSKVSRVKADMRSLATAIEAYATAHTRYPEKIDGSESPPYPEGYVRYRLTSLTTPCPYITSLPGDPFCDKNLAFGGRDGDKPSFVYLIRGTKKYPIMHPWDYYYASSLAQPDGSGSYQQFYLCVKSPSIFWVLVSQGPTKPDTNYILWWPYDPTNGTVSKGIIVRAGP